MLDREPSWKLQIKMLKRWCTRLLWDNINELRKEKRMKSNVSTRNWLKFLCHLSAGLWCETRSHDLCLLSRLTKTWEKPETAGWIQAKYICFGLCSFLFDNKWKTKKKKDWRLSTIHWQNCRDTLAKFSLIWVDHCSNPPHFDVSNVVTCTTVMKLNPG